MYYNGANCDIYIGKGAGKKLLEDLRSASRSIKIVSPFLSPFLITELIESKKKGIDIRLITMDEIEDYKDSSYRKNIYQLIRQNCWLDKSAQQVRDKWKKIARYLLGGAIFFTTLVIILFICLYDVRTLLGILPALILFLLYMLYKKKIKMKRIYSYDYFQLFPFKVYKSPNRHSDSDMFIHSKIYIIDDKIVYLGSLNFTSSGTKHNYETRVRTTDRDTVNKIRDEFNDLFSNSRLPEVNIQSWGRSLYREPIN